MPCKLPITKKKEMFQSSLSMDWPTEGHPWSRNNNLVYIHFTSSSEVVYLLCLFSRSPVGRRRSFRLREQVPHAGQLLQAASSSAGERWKRPPFLQDGASLLVQVISVLYFHSLRLFFSPCCFYLLFTRSVILKKNLPVGPDQGHLVVSV